MQQLLRDIAEIGAGQGAPQGDSNYCDHGIPFVKAGNLQDLTAGGSIDDIQKVSEEVAKKHKLKLYPKGTVLFAKSGMSCLKGYVYVLSRDAYVVSHLACVTPKADLSEYLRLYFAYHKPNQLVKDAAYPSISLSDIGALEINIKDKQAREGIITILNAVERVIEMRKREIQKLDDLIKARFVEMFGDPEINPKGWKKGPLKDHAEVFVGYPFPSEGYSEEGIDIVGGYNLMQGYIQWDDSKHWPNKTGYEQYLLQANDIVMAMDRPWVNGGFKIARVDNSHLPALLIQRTACIRSQELSQEFLHIMLDSQRFAEHCNVTGSLVPHISNKDINSFQVILPPMELQNEFSAFVAQVDKSKVAVQKALGETQLLFDSLMQQYFG